MSSNKALIFGSKIY